MRESGQSQVSCKREREGERREVVFALTPSFPSQEPAATTYIEHENRELLQEKLRGQVRLENASVALV